jgi:hypothetical protein
MHPEMAYTLVRDRHLERTKAAEHHRFLSSVSAGTTWMQRAAQWARTFRYRPPATPARLGVRTEAPAVRTS